ncbi:MAG: GNAT family N-acetyltransferase [Bacteroidales bacterium]
MKYFKYGVVLSRLSAEDIELLRIKRNSEEVRRFMDYREDITPEMQVKWLDKINNFNNFYFIIQYNDEKIGLLHDNDIDWEAKTSFSGLYLWEQKYINTFVPTLVSLCSIEVAYYLLGWNKTTIKIMNDNKQAIQYAKMLGYVEDEESDNGNHKHYYLLKENFEKNCSKIRKAAEALTQNMKYKDVGMLLEPQDYVSGLAQKMEKIVLENISGVIKTETEHGVYYTLKPLKINNEIK